MRLKSEEHEEEEEEEATALVETVGAAGVGAAVGAAASANGTGVCCEAGGPKYGAKELRDGGPEPKNAGEFIAGAMLFMGTMKGCWGGTSGVPASASGFGTACGELPTGPM